jgi:uncharacterized NAD(P)/FAD-binding protein YdhS
VVSYAAMSSQKKPLRVGIVGAGFTGTALAAQLQRLSPDPIDIILCDKSGRFGAGPAYSTPFLHHLLNVRVQDMSAFEDDLDHFSHWLSKQKDKHVHLDAKVPLSQQFVPRNFYYDYLQDLIKSMPSATFVAAEVVDIELKDKQLSLLLHGQRRIDVDKVVLALGNPPPVSFPFPVSDDIHCIHHPWDYTAVNSIGKHDPVLIVGSGLSMIDAVLTLHHQQHCGPINVVSRHGLLPLPHADSRSVNFFDAKQMSSTLRGLAKQIRLVSKSHMQEGGDWRSVMNALRSLTPSLWGELSLGDKKRFLRHVLPYWNVHRHRVHTAIMEKLDQLSRDGQLNVYGARVLEVAAGKAKISQRHVRQVADIPVTWLVNCMGPAQYMQAGHQPLLAALLDRQVVKLDPLKLGFAIAPSCALIDSQGVVSERLYALGASTKGELWEINAVPDLRRQIFALSRHLLAMK